MTPREVFDAMRDYWVNGTEHAVWAPDLVTEIPFAPPGRPKRSEHAEFVEFARAERAKLPVTFEECNIIAFHDTTDPAVAVVEYELVGILHATGERHSAQFIGVLTVRDGKITHWREYQDTALMTRLLAN